MSYDPSGKFPVPHRLKFPEIKVKPKPAPKKEVRTPSTATKVTHKSLNQKLKWGEEGVCARDGCGKTFVNRNRDPTNPQLYCSVACKWVVWNNEHPRTGEKVRAGVGGRKKMSDQKGDQGV